MIPLARKTLAYEWRRFLPAALAMGFAALLQLLQIALVLGIFSSASLYVTASGGDLWVGRPGTQSVSLGRSLGPDVESRIRLDPDVAAVEPLLWVDAELLGASGTATLYVTGIEPRPDGLVFSGLLTPAQRALLEAPDAVILDRADLRKLGLAVGSTALINGQPMRVAAAVKGLRALGGVNVVTSIAAARHLDPSAARRPGPTYLVVRLRAGASAATAARRLCCDAAFGPYAVWPARDFAWRSELYWLFDTGAGAGVLFLALVVFVAGAAISSQALMGAIAGSVREYATLKALGIGDRALRRVILEQAFIIGVIGLLGAGALGAVLLVLARAEDVPVELNLIVSGACMVVAIGIAAVSGLAATRSLRRADPASLLR